jgi:hypothetical protein
MTKQQRELLTFFGILVVLGTILIIRFSGGGDETPPAVPPVTAAGSTAQAGSTPAPGTGTQPGTAPDDLTVDQVPIEMLNPALSDSAVAARITTGSLTNPFAQNRRTTPVRQPTRQPTRDPAPVQRLSRERTLERWPEELQYQSLLERSDNPGVYRVRINGSWYEMGDTVTGTSWQLLEVNARIIRLQKKEQTREGNQIIDWTYYFNYVIPPAGSRSP